MKIVSSCLVLGAEWSSFHARVVAVHLTSFFTCQLGRPGERGSRLSIVWHLRESTPGETRTRHLCALCVSAIGRAFSYKSIGFCVDEQWPLRWQPQLVVSLIFDDGARCFAFFRWAFSRKVGGK